MTECRIITYAVPDGPPFYVNGAMRAVHRCETHNFDIPGPFTENALCPLGRIEKATDDALAKIAAAHGL